MKIVLDPVRGMKDFVPPESELLSWICDTFKEVATSFGFREIRTPTIERFELFALKSGEEIRNTMYVFKDKAGREVALRPEVTPSVVRVYLKELKAWPKPIKLFYIANVFRYDEPQFGRYREFTQAGVEILGADGVHYDVELIELLEEFYDRLGLKDRWYKVNNVAILRSLAASAGFTEEEIEKILHALDKEMFDYVIKLFREKGAERQAQLLKRIVEIRHTSSPSELRELLHENLRELQRLEEEITYFEEYIERLKSLGVRLGVDLAFARGIAYYTGIIFEVKTSNLPISIAGGGRYDNLTLVYGGDEVKCTGFAIGVERTLLALQRAALQKIKEKNKVMVVLLKDDVESYRKAYEISKMLRSKGFVVQLEVATHSRRLSRWLEYASRNGFVYVVLLGPRELEKGIATVRNLRLWQQKEVPIKDLVTVLEGEGRG